MPEELSVAAIRWGSIGPLVLTSLAIMGSPGPATISLLAAGSAHGVRRSLPYLIGIIIGTTTVLLAVATGVTAAVLAIPAIGPVLIGVSAAYILWLAYHIALAPPLADRTTASNAPSLAGGSFLGVANPKAWVAIAAVFTGSRLANPATIDAFAKIVVLAAMIVVINATWLVAGRSLAPLLRNPSRARVLNTVLAVALVGATALSVLH
jgi:threonine/homoserine/homoserine lactone efflux protein